MILWHYFLGGNQCGPISQELLVRYLSTNYVPADVLVWKEGMDAWVPANTLPQLAARPVPQTEIASPRSAPPLSVKSRIAHFLRPRRASPLVVLPIIAVLTCTVLYLHWQQDHLPTPPFADLKTAVINSFKMETTEPIHTIDTYFMEFQDDQGNRYQTEALKKPLVGEIASDMQKSQPITIHYAPCRSTFHSATIFTIYQMETPDTVLLSYDDRAKEEALLRNASIPIALAALMTVAVVCFIAIKVVAPRMQRY